MVREIDFQLTEGLKEELNVLNNINHKEAIESFRDLDHFFAPFKGKTEKLELEYTTKHLQPTHKFIDTVPGIGHSTIYLDSKGFEVFAIEPSIKYCYLIDGLAKKLVKKLNYLIAQLNF